MAAQPTFNTRQQLHLRIDPFSYKNRPSPQSTPPSSADIDRHNAMTPATASIASSTLCSVICMYDFRSEDPDHLSFGKHDILDIVKMEESGWWAAVRSDGDQIGWIPKAFVNTLSNEMADRLRNTRKELRGYEYNAEQLYTSAPTQSISPLYEHAGPNNASPHHISRWRVEVRNRRTPSPHTALSSKSQDNSQPSSYPEAPYRNMFRYRKPSREFLSQTQPPPTYTSSPVHDKSGMFSFSSDSEDVPRTRDRAGTLPSHTAKRRPSTRLRTLHEAASFTGPSRSWGTSENREQSRSTRTESESRQTTVPCPPHSEELGLDNDGQVLYGTVSKLLEKLASDNSNLDHSKIEKHTMFRNTFMMTFRTFMTADELFKRLVDTFRKEPPDDLAADDLMAWKKHHAVTQRCVLMIFTMWLEDHRLLDEEPHIAKELSDFLREIVSPPLASVARLLTKSIQRLTFTNPSAPTSISPIATPRKTKKLKAHKNDLIKLDPVDIAEQITLFEFQKYNKVTPQECLRHATGKLATGGLSTFCATHDKLVFWVRVSVLENDALGKRADTIDFWIKVAEKCKNLENFASMSAIVTALSSTVITRLHLTWAHVGRKSAYESLSRYNDPTGNFAGYRSLMRDVEGSCIPFVIMFLTDLVHIDDQYSDDDGRLCFFKRQRWYEVVTAMLRYQSRPYDIAENDSTMGFVTKHLRDLEEGWKDHNWFWSRSQEVQQTEMAHADLRRGLEAAGF